MEPPLADTAVLVTGASSGIGAAAARRLAQDGAAVALMARRRDRLQALAASIENAGGTALAIEADITDRTQAEAAVQQAAGQFGRLDILVNNAGRPGQAGLVVEAEEGFPAVAQFLKRLAQGRDAVESDQFGLGRIRSAL